MATGWRCLLCAAFTAAFAVPTHAQEIPRSSDERFGWTLNLAWENDIANGGSDQHYTNGIQGSLSSPKSRVFDWLSVATQEVFPLLEDTKFQGEIAVSQTMFTPENISLTVPDPTDRPYAGVTLLSISLVGDTPLYRTDTNGTRPEKNTRFDQFAYYVGVLGPSSGADETQRFVHRVLDAQRPEGWEYQIPDHWVAGISYRTTRNLFPSASVESERGVDVFPHMGFSLGTLRTDVEAGITLRAGINRPRDFGLQRLAPSLPGSSYFSSRYDRGAYAFAGVSQRFVAYDATLDERPLAGPGVDRRDWVTDVQIGVAAYVGCWRGGYTHVWRSREFHGQDDTHSFGALAVSYSLPMNRGHGWSCAARR